MPPPVVVIEIPSGLWNIAAWIVAIQIPFAFLALAGVALAILKTTGKKVEQSEKEEKPIGDTLKRAGRGVAAILALLGGFVLTLLFILPRRVEFFNFMIALVNGVLALAGLNFRLPLLETF